MLNKIDEHAVEWFQTRERVLEFIKKSDLTVSQFVETVSPDKEQYRYKRSLTENGEIEARKIVRREKFYLQLQNDFVKAINDKTMEFVKLTPRHVLQDISLKNIAKYFPLHGANFSFFNGDQSDNIYSEVDVTDHTVGQVRQSDKQEVIATVLLALVQNSGVNPERFIFEFVKLCRNALEFRGFSGVLRIKNARNLFWL